MLSLNFSWKEALIGPVMLTACAEGGKVVNFLERGIMSYLVISQFVVLSPL